MPVQNESGLWQAWRMPDGSCVVQALNHEYQPWGTSYLMEREEFHSLLVPLASTGTEGSFGRNLRALRSDTPDLLYIWYEQALEEEKKNPARTLGKIRGGFGEPAASDPAETRPGREGRTPVLAADESALASVWDPENWWDEEEQTDPDPYSLENLVNPANRTASRAAPPPRAEAESGQNDASGNSKAFLHPGIARLTHDALAPRHGIGPLERAAHKERNLRLEGAMRAQFEALSDQLDESPYPAVESEIALLLQRGAGFSAEQRFMFSEFGLTLRRKRKYDLALLAHSRALQLAPDDANILFNVARAKYELGAVDEAKAYLRKTLNKSPDCTSARVFLDFLNGPAK